MEYFDGQETPEKDNIVQPKSKFTPPRNRDITLDNYVDFLTKQPLDTTRKTNNLSKSELDALRDLQNDKSIIIKEADKGGAFVIMDAIYYKQKIEDMLNDERTYKRISNEKEHDAKKILEKFTKKYDKSLTKDEQKYISNFDMRTSNLYGLPKIHKSKSIIDAINQQRSHYVTVQNVEDLKFRPIIAGPTCATSHLSSFLDEILKPLLPEIKSFIKDDHDFLQKLDRNMSGQHLFASFDVESLYTNINHSLGKEAINFWINKCRTKLPGRLSKNLIIEAIDIVLKNNVFFFDDILYLQLSGTAMGTKMAPTYANLVLGYLEIKLYEECEKLQDLNFRTFIEDGWKRYLDDGYITWSNEFGNINILETLLNNLHPNINFTTETNGNCIPFLDIMLQRDNSKGQIITDIYHKKTDTFNYLPISIRVIHVILNGISHTPWPEESAF